MLLLLPGRSAAGLLQPDDLEYRGAFRLPDAPGDYGWEWGGHGLAYCPEGDPGGPADGYPGSLFGTGHDWYQQVSEVSIPVPVVSAGKNLEELNAASTLQPFSDIKGGLFPAFEIPYCDLEYLPPRGGQGSGKLYFCWHDHLQIAASFPTHGWCETDLSAPRSAGPWYVGSYDTYSTTDYLFAVPEDWAAAHVGGRSLATGRFRDGGQGGQGPCIFALAPWQHGDPPPAQAVLSAVPLLLYSTTYWDDPHGGAYAMDRYHHSDMWAGAAWLTAGADSAVVFVGTKGRGECWYGNQDGPCLDCEDRGWWSTYFDGEMIFYDPADLAAVAAGTMQPYEPQPYAVMSLDHLLYHVVSPQMRHHVKAASFDRAGGLLYVFEPLADSDRPLVHVWKVSGGGPTPPPSPTPAPSPRTVAARSGDYDGDGRDEIAVFRPATGMWAARGLGRVSFGGPGDAPVPGDYDGDGTASVAVFRSAGGLWAVRSATRFSFGSPEDAPVPGDYDGDGTCEAAVFRGSWGLWSVRGLTLAFLGGPGDAPVPGDYDGDGADDPGVFGPDRGEWAVRGITRAAFGGPGDLPAAGDYDGDGTAEIGIFRPASGLWAIRETTRFRLGSADDWAAPADFAGSGRDAAAIFRAPNGLWAIPDLTRAHFGGAGDAPVTR